jgi:HKD family nuclease
MLELGEKVIMKQEHLSELRDGLETAYINGTVASSLSYTPQFISNNYKVGKKVLSSVEEELLACEQFQISVAFITMSGIQK